MTIEEATIESVLIMGAQSLSPDAYDALDALLCSLKKIRGIK